MRALTKQPDSAPLGPVVRVAIPVLVESCLRTLLGNVDQWMLSGYSGTAVAAVGNANQILNMGLMVLEMVCTATTIILAQYIGAKREKETEKLYTLSLSIILVLSLVMGALLVGLRRQIFHWMNVPEELVQDAGVYLAIVGGSLAFQGLFQGISAIFRSHAMMKEIMVGSVGMNLVNVAVNFLLINGWGPFPRMGVAGAALATALSRVAGVVFMGRIFMARLHFRIDWQALRHPDLPAIGRLFRIGLPAAGDSFSYNCMQLVLLSLINTFGTAAVTAKVYAGSVLPFVYIFTSSLATATQIQVGYYVGGREPDKAQKLVQKSTWLAIASSEALSILLFIFCEPVFGIFTQDPAVLALMRSILAVDIVLEVGRAVNIMMIRALLSAGDTSFPLYCALSSQWGVGVVLSFVFGQFLGLGITGVWIGMAADEWCRALAFLLRWKSGRWKKKRLL